VRNVQAEIDGLVRTRRAFLLQLRAIAQRQLAEIDAADSALHGHRVESPMEVDTADPTPWITDLVKKQ